MPIDQNGAFLDDPMCCQVCQGLILTNVNDYIAHINSADHKNEYVKSRMTGEIVGDVDTRTFVEILDEEIDFFNEKHNAFVAEMATNMTLKDEEDEEEQSEHSAIAKSEQEAQDDVEMSDNDQLEEKVVQLMDDLQASMSQEKFSNLIEAAIESNSIEKNYMQHINRCATSSIIIGKDEPPMRQIDEEMQEEKLEE